MYFRQIFEPKLAQNSYVIGCQESGEAIVIDPMRDIERYMGLAAQESLTIIATAETHIHVDYLSGSREFAEQLNAKVYVSDCGDKDWKYDWVIKGQYHHQLLRHADAFFIGNIKFEVISTPGHTQEHISLLVSDTKSSADSPVGILSGDFVFVGDVGRPDLLESAAGLQQIMKPAAGILYRSLQQFKSLPSFLQLWPGHGAGSACGKSLGAMPMSTVGYELQFNPSILAADDEEAFVEYILEG